MSRPNLAEFPSDLLDGFRLEPNEQLQNHEQLLIGIEQRPDEPRTASDGRCTTALLATSSADF